MAKSIQAQQAEARAALHGRILANRFVAVGVALLMGAAVYFWFYGDRPQQHALRIAAGDPLTHRYKLAQTLVDESKKHGLDLELVKTAGSQAALEGLADGSLDVALALGDYDFPDDNVREVAVLQDEALQLFVRPELIAGGLTGLRGKTISLSAKGTNTRVVARDLLEFVGLAAGSDYQELDYSHSELKDLPTDKLPDGIFAITPLPWEEVGSVLVKKHGYALMELPFAAAASLRNPSVRDLTIPAYTYGLKPAVPERPIHTVGQRLLVVARRTTSSAAIERLMKVLFESEFSRRARLPSLDAVAVITDHEFPLHEGTIKYLHRNEPLIKSDSIDRLENLRSFLVSAALALFLFWRWNKRRNLIGFETFLDAVSEIELSALGMERDGQIDVNELRRMRQRLSEIKGQALEFQSEGMLSNEELMVSFLTHVFDVRMFLESLLNQPQQPNRPTPQSPQSPANDEAGRAVSAKMENP